MYKKLIEYMTIALSIGGTLCLVAYGAGSNTGPASEKFDNILTEWNTKVEKMGHLTGEYYETEFNDYSRSAERTPLKEGMFTETKTGKPISKLMGKFKDYDCGYTSVGTSPFNSLLMCNDFATLFTWYSYLLMAGVLCGQYYLFLLLVLYLLEKDSIIY